MALCGNTASGLAGILALNDSTEMSERGCDRARSFFVTVEGGGAFFSLFFTFHCLVITNPGKPAVSLR